MDKIELRARARDAALDNGLLEFGPEGHSSVAETRGRSATRARPLLPPIDSVDEAQARAACKPMGELEYLIRSVDAKGRGRVMYVIVPDPALSPHYERLGFRIEPGCRVLVDATQMKAVAVLRLSASLERQTLPRPHPTAGYNPYFDLPCT